MRHPTQQRAAGQLSAADVFHGGQIIAVSLGGFASGPNLFPRQRNFNVGAYARLERVWRQSLRAGVTVSVDIALSLGPDPAAPEFLVVTYWEDDELWEAGLDLDMSNCDGPPHPQAGPGHREGQAGRAE